ncbi:hypothetical protein HPP92_004905 [Vanilla planifolia]|uniref:Terpene synthase metal-binding domain-containing protein n=1 Tax=Vanilla planifolia TaxID=51239 RepID=A0A835RTA6_VANPL|nr:hypothetical protein HPP92_004905 [Vanilla planifolia]
MVIWSKVGIKEKEEEKIERLVGQIKEIFASLGDGNSSPSAYDTAWVARIPSVEDLKKPQFPLAIEWILKNQMEGGSWGDHLFFMIDRLVCTLSCVITLKLWKQGDGHLTKGLQFLQARLQDLEIEKDLERKVGFEILFPSLLNEAKSLGLDLPYELSCMKHISKLREKKMSRIPLEMLHNVHTTLLFSLEGIQDLVQWDRIMKLQSQNGSFSDSPAATAAAYLNTGDKMCLEYLTYVVSRFQDHDVMELYKDDDNSFIEWALKNPWKITPPWIGVREYIDNYGDKDVWIAKCLYRIAYTKWNSLENLLKDIFQNHESIEDLQLFSRAINEWKPSLIMTLPVPLQRVFMGVYETMNELAIKGNSIQGKDVFLCLHDLRKLQVQEYLNIRQFKDANHFECLEEYVEQLKRGLGISIRLLPAMFLMEGVLQEKALQYLDPRSKMHEQLAFILALLNPVIEDWTAVSIYMNKYNCSKEDAIRYIENKIDDAFAELTHEYLKPSNHALDSCRRLIFEHIRITRFYLDKVGNDQFDEVMKRAYTPIP